MDAHNLNMTSRVLRAGAADSGNACRPRARAAAARVREWALGGLVASATEARQRAPGNPAAERLRLLDRRPGTNNRATTCTAPPTGQRTAWLPPSPTRGRAAERRLRC